MNNEQKTNIEHWDEFFADLHKKHPDTIFSLDPAEREEEMKNEPVLTVEELKIVLDRPLDPNASPEEIELHKQCRIFLQETLIPMEEGLKKLERGEYDAPENTGEDDTGHTEVPPPEYTGRNEKRNTREASMSNEQKTNIERADEYYAALRKKHPDTLYSLDPAEREEEMKNEPVLTVEELKIVLDRPLDPNASPEEIELHKQCRIFLQETLIPNEEFLKRLEAGEFDGSEICIGESDPGEDDPETTEIPSLIENEDDNN